MKRFVLGAAIALAVVVSSPPVHAETVIRVTLQLPGKHPLGQNWLAFKQIIEEKSNGELKLLLFPSAQLFKDNQVPDAVGSGAIEAGSSFIGRFAGSVPAVDVISLPFLFDTEQKLRSATAADSPVRQILDAAILRETGARVLWWQAYGRNVYLSNKFAVRLPSDLKGKKVRTYGKVLGWTVEALGGVPTLMSGSKQFLAYQQGAVDVGMTGVSAVKSRKLYEVMDHMTLSFDSVIEFVAVINNHFFESLSPENRQIMRDAAAVVEKQLRDHIYADEAAIVNEMRSKMTVTDLSENERAHWKKASRGVIERFTKAFGPDAAAVVEAANSL